MVNAVHLETFRVVIPRPAICYSFISHPTMNEHTYCRVCGHTSHAASNSVVLSTACDAIFHKHCAPSTCICGNESCEYVVYPFQQCTANMCDEACTKMFCRNCVLVLRHKLEHILDIRGSDGIAEDILMCQFQTLVDMPRWVKDLRRSSSLYLLLQKAFRHVCTTFEYQHGVFVSFTAALIEAIKTSQKISFRDVDLHALGLLQKLSTTERDHRIHTLKLFLKSQSNTSTEKLGMTIMKDGSIRKQTRLMIYDSQTMLKRIQNNATRGVCVQDIVAEYTNAYSDLKELQKAKKVWLSPCNSVAFPKTLVCEQLDGLLHNWKYTH